MASVPNDVHLTRQQYLAMERKSDVKHEFYRGEMFAMAGTSVDHNRITGNLNFALRNHFGDGPCEVFSNDMRVKVQASGLYTYPDLVVVCGEPQFEDDKFDILLNPLVIIEVLSPSTESYDRGKKFAMYREIPSLRDYLLITQDAVLVERFTLRDDGWSLFGWTSLEDAARVESIDCAIPLRDIYARVTIAKPA